MGGEQTSCFTRNTAGLETEIINHNNNRKKLSEKINRNSKNYYNSNYKSVEQINSSLSTHTRSNSPSQLVYLNKVTTIQKNIRLFITKKKFKERIELLLNIIELDNTVNLIKDKNTCIKILSENKGEQLWKDLITKKKIIPFEDTSENLRENADTIYKIMNILLAIL